MSELALQEAVEQPGIFIGGDSPIQATPALCVRRINAQALLDTTSPLVLAWAELARLSPGRSLCHTRTGVFSNAQRVQTRILCDHRTAVSIGTHTSRNPGTSIQPLLLL